MAAVTAVVAGVGKAVGGAVKAGKAHKEMRRARGRKQEAKFQMESARANRAEITNPYAGVTDLSGLASDLSSQITNPYNQLTVSTAAAEMQAEEADIALANTLDTLRATGTSAGGATALAQAALQSKQGVAASIEQQESQNEKLRVEGEKQRQQELMSERQRQQQADVAGAQFTFGIREGREQQQIDRTYSELQAARQAAAMAGADATSAITGAIGGIANVAGSYMGAQANVV